MVQKYWTLAFFVTFLSLIGCNYEEDDAFSSSGQNVSEERLIYPSSPEDEGYLYSFRTKPAYINNPHDVDCLNEKQNFSPDVFFANSEHLVQFQPRECGDFTLCNRSQFGVNSTVIKGTISRNFGLDPLPREIDLIFLDGCNSSKLQDEYLVSLFKYGDSFFAFEYLGLADSSEEAELRAKFCTVSTLPVKVSSLADAYDAYLRKRGPLEDIQKERSVNMYSESCITNANAMEERNASRSEESTPEEGAEVEDSFDE